MSLIRDIVMFLCGFLMVDWTTAQILALGSCPNVNVVSNFDPAKYLGRWYEVEKYFFFAEVGGKCVTADYTDLGNQTVGVVNSQISTLFGNSKRSVSGKATIADPSVGKLTVTFPVSPFAAPYFVIDTDYTSYALVWSCNDLKIGITLRSSWILTRERNPSPDALTKAYEAAERNGIDRKPYQKTDQSDCPADS